MPALLALLALDAWAALLVLLLWVAFAVLVAFVALLGFNCSVHLLGAPLVFPGWASSSPPPPPIDFLMGSRAWFPCLVLVMCVGREGEGGSWTPSIEGFSLFSACFCFTWRH